MSLDVTSRFTGGAYLIPLRSLIVSVFWSGETSGSASAMSGRGLLMSPGP
jgi:hypothetical protein